MMAMDKDESTRRMERDAEAEVKRQQNALPAWHLKSTITGDLTALGVKENARDAISGIVGVGGAGQMSNDDILKGLGVAGGSSRSSDLTTHSQPHLGRSMEDVKPIINVEADLYDQYYASLAASSSATSAHPTPTATGVPSTSSNSPDFPNSYLNDDDEEEDKKPNVEYLDSLNAYRKRSRSQEDVGSADKIKLARTASTGDLGITNGHANGFLAVNGFGHYGNGNGFGAVPQDETMHSQELDEGLALPEDDPMIFVNGAPKPYSQVTEDDHDLMTPDEYTAFFEVMQARS